MPPKKEKKAAGLINKNTFLLKENCINDRNQKLFKINHLQSMKLY